MTRGYAEGTSVPVERSRAEIDAVLTKSGATSTAILNDDEKNMLAVAFTMKGARFRIELPLPTVEDVKRSRRRVDVAQLRRERWRAVLLLLKSKLEIVRMGLYSLEHEFMADMVLPDGTLAHQAFTEAIRRGLGSSDGPKMLGQGPPT